MADWNRRLRAARETAVERSPWLLLSALAVIMLPLLVSRASMSLARLDLRPALFLGAMAVAYGATLLGTAGSLPEPFRRPRPAVVIGAALLMSAGLGGHWLIVDGVDDALSAWAGQWWLLPLVVAGVNAVDRDAGAGVFLAAAGLWLLAMLFDQHLEFYYACNSPPSPAEGAACAAVDNLASRAVPAALGATIAAAGAMRRSIRRKHPRSMVALAVLGLWLASRAVVDGCAAVAAQLACTPSLVVDPLETLAGVARWVSGLSTAMLIGAVGAAAWSVAATLGEPRPRKSWRHLWVLLPALLLASSPAFQPRVFTSSMQQMPEPVWEPEVDPLTLPEVAGPPMIVTARSRYQVVATLEATGHLIVLHAGGRVELDRDEVLAPPMERFDEEAVRLLVDRHATLGSLRSAAHQLRAAGALAVQWRANEIHRAEQARDRWAVVEVASRSLRSRRVELVEPWEKTRTDLRVIGAADDVPIRRWLRETRGTAQHALVVSRALEPDDEEAYVSGGRRAPDELFLRWLPRDVHWISALALLLLLGGLMLHPSKWSRSAAHRWVWLVGRCASSWISLVALATAVGWWLMSF